ncbi:uncharacterized protein [Oryctolagus cuniculus]|uniref:uncharacterized protein n=1 Tax=Oryctolagus cuniculus TaxID=9986 RepID=UPI003879A9DE
MRFHGGRYAPAEKTEGGHKDTRRPHCLPRHPPQGLQGPQGQQMSTSPGGRRSCSSAPGTLPLRQLISERPLHSPALRRGGDWEVECGAGCCWQGALGRGLQFPEGTAAGGGGALPLVCASPSPVGWCSRNPRSWLVLPRCGERPARFQTVFLHTQVVCLKSRPTASSGRRERGIGCLKIWLPVSPAHRPAAKFGASTRVPGRETGRGRRISSCSLRLQKQNPSSYPFYLRAIVWRPAAVTGLLSQEAAVMNEYHSENT